MSRIGKAPIQVPAGVEISVSGTVVTVKGKLGTLTQEIHPDITLQQEGGVVTVLRANEEKQTRAKHGLYRALINNMVVGVSNGWSKELELVGVGYRASNQGQILDLSLGYSHTIMVQIPSEVALETKSEKGKNPLIILKSFDKQLLGMIAAKIRSFRKPEPYKGKGVRYVNEVVRRKAGKSAGKGKK
jgi:large subunit ribosomal protein L6